jgi:TonB-linked SusC/RagA family outer membrane protein
MELTDMKSIKERFKNKINQHMNSGKAFFCGIKEFMYGILLTCIMKQKFNLMQFKYDISAHKGIITAIVMMLITPVIYAQDTLTVEGIVLAKPNQPVSEVTVSVEGSAALPAVTDESGKFTINAKTGNDWIIISPTGNYKTKRVFLNNRDYLTIFLTPMDVSSGYDELTILNQPRDKRNIVSSYSDLSVSTIHHTPSLSVDEFMQGKIPGMNVINRSGLPGSGAVTNIRGVNSMNTSNQPLFVVDGIPLNQHGVMSSNLDGYAYNPLLRINPLDISKISVVKDPAVTAAYGSKGSNGVVFIETLDPSVTQTSIEFDFRGGYSLTPPNLIPQLNAQQHKTLMSEVLFTSPMLEENIRENYPALFLTPDEEGYIDYQHNTNWQEIIYDESYFTNINVKVKGGDEIARYGLSFGYYNSNGIIETTNYQGYNLRFVSRLNVFKWLKMDAGVSLNYNNSELKEAATVDETSPIMTSLAKSPLLNPYQYDIEGREISIISNVDELGVSNPLAVIENYSAANNNYNFISTLNLESDFSSAFSINSSFSISYDVMKEQLFMPNQGMELYYNQEAQNVANISNNTFNTFFNNTYLGFSKAFGNNHMLTSHTGMNVQTNSYEFDWGLTKNAHPNDQYRALQDGQNSLREIGGQNRTWNWISFYENLNYAYKDKYLVSASVSLDGSSRVGENAKNTMSVLNEPFGLFYGAGVGWRLSSEPFLKNISLLEELKLRVSYGKSGNDDIGEGSATNYYQNHKFRETVGLYPAVIPNDELTYETVSQMNTGIDIALWGSRVSANVDFFMSTTDDMLIFSPVDEYLGYSLRLENGGAMENQGWEVGTFFRIFDGYSFKWDVNAYISNIRTEVTKVQGDALVDEIAGGEIVNKVGAPANSFYGYLYEGVYSTNQEAQEAGLINDRGFEYSAGDAKFADISGPDGSPDGVINDLDKTIIGSSVPEYFGGLMSSFSFRNWKLSGYVQFISGNEVFNYVRYKNESMTGLENQSAKTLDRWQYAEQETDMPRALWNDPIGNSSFSSRWIEDGTYLRVKSISLSYKIPEQFLAFQNAEFYISANNIFTFSDYLGYDPEFAYSFSHSHRGIDYGQMPQPRQFIAGIKVGL